MQIESSFHMSGFNILTKLKVKRGMTFKILIEDKYIKKI